MTSERDAMSVLSEGRELLQAGNFERAISCFDQVISLDPNQMLLSSAYMNRLTALRKLGRNQEADPDEGKWEEVKEAALERRAIAERERRDSPVQPVPLKAEPTVEEAEKIEQLRRTNEKLSEGVQLLQEEDFEGALACFDQVIALEPSLPVQIRAYQNRTDALWKLGRTEEARASGETAESLQPPALSAAIGSGEEEESGGGMHMLIGGLFFLGGLIATIYTYTSAAPGGTYSIYWGAMVIGAIQFVWGLSKS